MTISTKVSSRLPNSIAPCRPSSGWDTKDSSVQRGQVGQPRPEPVSRTSPPVTTIPMLATREAIAQRGRARGPRTTRVRSIGTTSGSGLPPTSQTSSTASSASGAPGRSPPLAAPRRGPRSAAGPGPAAGRPGSGPAARPGRPGQQHDVDQVGHGQGDLGPQPAGQEQRQADERRGGDDHQRDRRQRRPRSERGPPAQRQADRGQDRRADRPGSAAPRRPCRRAARTGRAGWRPAARGRRTGARTRW